MKNIIIAENIRSAYNVGNIVRTADALGRDMVTSGYTASPLTHPKVQKSSLGAQNHISIKEFREPQEALKYAQSMGYTLIAAEITENSLSLSDFSKNYHGHGQRPPLAVVVGNEVEGVLPATLSFVDHIVHIPMSGQKESLNVGQASAIFMRELS